MDRRSDPSRKILSGHVRIALNFKICFSRADREAERRSSSAAGAEGHVARLTRELNEAREEQTATGDVVSNTACRWKLERLITLSPSPPISVSRRKAD
jgi:hypothetical protein